MVDTRDFMNEDNKIYGPYVCKDGRMRIVWTKGRKHHSMSYPKYLMEKHLNRRLEKDEQIDHIDGNPLNNNISNLQILKIGEHQSLDALRNRDAIVKCVYCGKKFVITGSKLHNRNRKDRHQSGYFCSRICSGKYGVDIQHKRTTSKKIDKIIPGKYKVKST